jgi:ParB family chromosome partitioning protein
MSKKLAAKASLIQLPPVLPPRDEAAPPAEPKAPRTAPGTMAHFMASQSVSSAALEALRERGKAFDGAAPVRLLDPRRIRPSRWANRHDASFAEAAFAALKDEIAAAGGNVQPIKVRPAGAAGADGPGAGGAARGQGASAAEAAADGEAYEIVFGHRRHRACLELGLPVAAVVEPLDDTRLFEAMERENRGRKSLSAWEQGMMYRRALDGGLYPSQRRLAEALSVDVALVSKALALARLPDAVVAAFATPLDIQFRWAQPLAEALQKDPDGLVARARAIAAEPGPRPARSVMQRLVQPAAGRAAPAPRRFGPEGRGASWTVEAGGSLSLRFDPGALSAARQRELERWLAKALG